MSRKHWIVAQEIERANALERVLLKRRPGRCSRTLKERVEDEYDPLAATALAMMLEARLP